jgi:hypothetical protein
VERALSLLLVLTVAAAAAAASAGAGAPRGAIRTTITGEIRQLDAKKIGVGRVSCTIPPKLSVKAGRFVIGVPVRISCLGSKLESVKYSPLVPNQTAGPGSTSAPATVTTPKASCGASCTTSVVYSIGTIFSGGGPSGDTTSATGRISDISGGSISAGGLTCSFKPVFDDLINRAARVGDNVTLTCTSGTFVGMKSVGSVSR